MDDNKQKMVEDLQLEVPAAEEAAQSEPLPEQAAIDNLVMADKIMEDFLPKFKWALKPLSNKQLRKLISVLVEFPFGDVSPKTLKTNQEKLAFMFGERLVYANMVKRARAELAKTFEQIENENKKEENNETVSVSDNQSDSK